MLRRLTRCGRRAVPPARPPAEEEEDEAWKILLVGDEQVGKTCLARRFHAGADAGGAAAGGFTESLPPTFSVDFVAATVETPEGRTQAHTSTPYRALIPRDISERLLAMTGARSTSTTPQAGRTSRTGCGIIIVQVPSSPHRNLQLMGATTREQSPPQRDF